MNTSVSIKPSKIGWKQVLTKYVLLQETKLAQTTYTKPFVLFSTGLTAMGEDAERMHRLFTCFTQMSRFLC